MWQYTSTGTRAAHFGTHPCENLNVSLVLSLNLDGSRSKAANKWSVVKPMADETIDLVFVHLSKMTDNTINTMTNRFHDRFASILLHFHFLVFAVKTIQRLCVSESISLAGLNAFQKALEQTFLEK